MNDAEHIALLKKETMAAIWKSRWADAEQRWCKLIARQCYKRGVTLEQIAVDGWSRGLLKGQTLIEASASGFALCVASPAIDRIWKQWDDSLAESGV